MGTSGESQAILPMLREGLRNPPVEIGREQFCAGNLVSSRMPIIMKVCKLLESLGSSYGSR